MKLAGRISILVPYLMSSHPGCTLKEAVELAEYLRDLGYMPEQVQDFYPTPSTISTCMYYTGLDPRTMEPVYVPKNPHEKAIAACADPVPQIRKIMIWCRKHCVWPVGTDLIGFGEAMPDPAAAAETKGCRHRKS